MSFVTIGGARISGISCVLPHDARNIYEIGEPYFKKDFIDRIAATVGTNTLYFADASLSAGDLGIKAADNLIAKLEWDRGEVGALIFNSQFLDYVVPPTSTNISHKLGLSENTFVMDTNYGCPGYPICLMLAWQLISSGLCDKLILINSAIHTRVTSRSDENTALIFGDAAAATAIEKCDNASPAYFMSKVDGNYVNDLILGNFKSADNAKILDHEHTYMDGEKVTKYMLRHIPSFVKDLLDKSETNASLIETFLFHQANAYMVRYLSKRLKIDPDKVPIDIDKFGNTTDVSIPLLICDKLSGLFAGGNNPQKTMMLGYGAGFILSGAILELDELVGGEICKI